MGRVPGGNHQSQRVPTEDPRHLRLYWVCDRMSVSWVADQPPLFGAWVPSPTGVSTSLRLPRHPREEVYEARPSSVPSGPVPSGGTTRTPDTRRMVGCRSDTVVGLRPTGLLSHRPDGTCVLPLVSPVLSGPRTPVADGPQVSDHRGRRCEWVDRTGRSGAVGLERVRRHRTRVTERGLGFSVPTSKSEWPVRPSTSQ